MAQSSDDEGEFISVERRKRRKRRRSIAPPLAALVRGAKDGNMSIVGGSVPREDS
jgi:hypothetical protein